MGALSHLKVLDLSRVLAGPWAGQMLGDLGAEVVKVERPGVGDDTRGWGPPFIVDPADGTPGDAAYFLAANRNKRSVTVDITTAEGQRIIRALAMDSDVVIENYKVGGLAAYGLDAATLCALTPRLIWCSITGFGQTGPYAARAGYDALIQAMGGLMSVTGGRDGEPGAGPQKVGVALIDIMTGLYASVGILAALAHRDRSGEGQVIDLALLDVSVATLANQAMNYLISGVAPERMGNAHPNIVPYQDFPTADGAIILAVGNDEQFARAWAAFGLAADAGLATNAMRVARRTFVVAAIADRAVTNTTAHWIAVLEAVGVPCGPINTIADVFADPQVVARELHRTMDHPIAGSVPTVANPLRLSATPVTYRTAPPMLGEANDTLLAALRDSPD